MIPDIVIFDETQPIHIIYTTIVSFLLIKVTYSLVKVIIG